PDVWMRCCPWRAAKSEGGWTSRARRHRASELERAQRLRVLADLSDLGGRRRHEALVGEITLLADGLVARVFGQEFGQTRDHSHVRLLHVDEQRSRGRIFARGDRLERGRHAVDERAAQLVEVLLEKAV